MEEVVEFGDGDEEDTGDVLKDAFSEGFVKADLLIWLLKRLLTRLFNTYIRVCRRIGENIEEGCSKVATIENIKKNESEPLDLITYNRLT